MKKRRHIKLAKTQSQRPKNRSIKKYSLFVVFGLLIATSVYMITVSVTSGARLASLEKEEEQLAKENSELSTKLFEKSSLLKTKKTAEQLGYTKPQNMLYIQSEETVAVVVH